MDLKNTNGYPKSAPNAAAPAPYVPQPAGQFPPMVQTNGGIHGQWTTGLFGCTEDPSSCCITCCCPCITFGQNAEIIDRGTTSCALAGLIYTALTYVGCGCLYSCTYRTKIRGLYSLQEDPCADFFVHCCCTACAICQEYRELKNRGFNPSIGWMANVEKLNRGGSTMPPTVVPGMAR